ncbi:MAG: PhoX family phosphatase [Alphaproteobacteria bacterium]|nr:PhoX family phosphatase [Alphaproteobacteria bacterium]
MNTGSSLKFSSLPHGKSDNLEVTEGYTATTLIRWGDPLFPGMAVFDPNTLTAEEQKKRFGYNNDYIAYMPLEGSSSHGLLCVNQEYSIARLMFPEALLKNYGAALGRIEMAAHGHSVLEIRKEAGRWRVVQESRHTRFLNGLDTVFILTGPAAGHARMQTSADPSGTKVIGTYSNCAGGKTPWGTVLFCEENVDLYFSGTTSDEVEKGNHDRLGIKKKGRYRWAEFDKRFRIDEEPREPNRFGWVVEYDPYDPQSTPKKRTALGRLKHESATPVACPDGRIAIYSGDDQKNEYLYRFVTAKRWNPQDRAANADLLDEGTLSAARFEEDGTLRWLPLVFGHGPLTPENGFHSQADVLIETRRAADLLGATPMDRPEDIEAHPTTGHVFVSLTHNETKTKANKANPRTPNPHGHILELIPPSADHAAEVFRWEIFLLAGDPFDAASGARYAEGIARNDYFSSPDNLAFDPQGRLWVATDGMDEMLGVNDGVYAMETSGAARALPRHFLNVPLGAEATGPEFTPDGTTFFLSVQHPGDNKGSFFDAPSTRWPDFDPSLPPRPSVIAVTREDGGKSGNRMLAAHTA